MFRWLKQKWYLFTHQQLPLIKAQNSGKREGNFKILVFGPYDIYEIKNPNEELFKKLQHAIIDEKDFNEDGLNFKYPYSVIKSFN